MEPVGAQGLSPLSDGDGPMKAVTAFAVLLALGAPFGASAQAKIAPLASQAVVTASEDLAASRLAAQREAEYFRTPQSPLASELLFPCRLQHVIFDKTRLAQSCH
jgi:hypothetical protein